jgi:hypothetical protein
LQSTIQRRETDPLLRIAVETTLVLRPETKDDFIEAVEMPYQFFIIEVIAIAAAMLIREACKRGRASEIKIKKYNDHGTLIEERTLTKFVSDGPFDFKMQHSYVVFYFFLPSYQ